ncbi:MAG: ORF6N domain-containing protein [Elusimicrobia bacterium]|nr:ORF6N domain-containing protein [Elusimicrobiota bacterium]
MASLVPVHDIERRIFLIRGHKVMLDHGLAELYGVATKALNQAVKRNKERFPGDFVFRLTAGERDEVVTICDHLRQLKFSPSSPFAFTENGVAMLSSVLRSRRAIMVNVRIMRTFTRLRHLISTHHELARKLEVLERKVESHDQSISGIFDVIRDMMEPAEEPRRPIGFQPRSPEKCREEGGLSQ